MVKSERNNYSYMTRRIGTTTYKVEVVFNEKGTETMKDKILRIIRNEIYTNGEKYDEMVSLQIINIINEWYAKDSSKKVRLVFCSKGQAGKPFYTNQLYGYIKDSADKLYWIVDAEQQRQSD